MGITWPCHAPTLVPFDINGASLLKTAMDYEDEQLDTGDDCEGAELTSNPPTPSPSRPPSPDPSESTHLTMARSQSPSPSELSSELSSAPPTPGPSRAPSPPTQPNPTPRPAPPLRTVEQRRKKDSAKVRKKKSRAAKAAAADPLKPYRPKAKQLKMLEKLASVPVKFNAKTLEGSGAGSYIGRRLKTNRKALTSVQQLRKAGIKINRWDGV